jgi:hypothetical protein
MTLEPAGGGNKPSLSTLRPPDKGMITKGHTVSFSERSAMPNDDIRRYVTATENQSNAQYQ